MLLLEPSTHGFEIIGSGSECIVYWWDAGHTQVLKTFNRLDIAHSTYERQRQAALVKCGPQADTRGVFRVWFVADDLPSRCRRYHWRHSDWRWAYISEAVDLVVRNDDYSAPESYYSDSNDLTSRCEEHGISVCDLHQANVGYLSDGTMVKLDFGPIST